jgi:hypothetical protein
MRSGYPRKHLGAVFEELLVAMMICLSDDLGAPRRTASTFPDISGSRAPTSAAALMP